MSYQNEFDTLDWGEIRESIYNKNETHVVSALNKTKLDLNDFQALISPAAENYLEQMAQKSRELTLQRFGNTIQLYIPFYLSNECQNICTYCGFSLDVDIPRKTLNPLEIRKEAEHVKGLGYDHILIVTGEANTTVGIHYLSKAIKILKEYFSYISVEVQPLSTEEYQTLENLGVQAVLVYQETYHKAEYKKHHPKGKKSNFNFRLKTPERIGEAKINKIGLGVLIGLEDWRTDSFFTASHLNYLEKHYWTSKYAISFPRLRPCANEPDPKSIITDKQLVQLICAYRLFNPELDLSLSTRESEVFRNNVIKLGVTSISAESSTEPGGYTNGKENLEQFEINDKRTTTEFKEVIINQGYEPVFKDWDQSLHQ